MSGMGKASNCVNLLILDVQSTTQCPLPLHLLITTSKCHDNFEGIVKSLRQLFVNFGFNEFMVFKRAIPSGTTCVLPHQKSLHLSQCVLKLLKVCHYMLYISNQHTQQIQSSTRIYLYVQTNVIKIIILKLKTQIYHGQQENSATKQ